MYLCYVLLFLPVFAVATPSRCPERVPQDCSRKCPQYAFDKKTKCSSCTCVKVDGLWENDIRLTDETEKLLRKLLNDKGKGGAATVSKWKVTKKKADWRIDYKLDPSLAQKAKDIIPHALAELELKTCLRFIPMRNLKPNYIKFIGGSGCWSYIGRLPAGRVNEVSIGNHCWYKGIVIHEIMHAIGFWHEQSRPDRDDFVNIIWANIISGKESNFQKQPAAGVESYGSAYDIGSVMHYGSTSFSIDRSGDPPKYTITDKNGGRLNTQRDGPSDSDIAQINAMYDCPAAEPCVDQKSRKACTRWKRRKICAKKPIKAVRFCRKSCGLC